ncbi:MAG: Dabb family protein [Pseudomonadota bacterium]
MILHVVMLRLRADPDRAELSDVMAGLAALVDRIPGFVGFEHGPNIDAEHKSPDFPYGFVCRFASADALAAYAANPTHQGLGARLVALCDGGGDGIMVYDLSL